MRRNRVLRTGGVLLLLAALLGALAACGSDNDSSEANTTTSTSGEAADDELEPIRVRYQPGTESLSGLPFQVAYAQGYFEEEGIDLEYLPLTADAGLVVAGLLEGATDMSTLGYTSLLDLLGTGQELVSLGNHTVQVQFVVLRNEIVAELAEQGVTPDSPFAEKMQALKGLSLASTPVGSSSYALLAGGLQSAGVNPEQDVTIRSIADNVAVYAAAREGQVDGFQQNEPFASQAVAEGWGTRWVDYAAEFEPIKDFSAATLMANPGWLSENEEAATRFMTAILRANEDLQERADDEALQDLVRAEWYEAIDEEVFREAFVSIAGTLSTMPTPTEDQHAKALEWVNLLREQAGEPPHDFSFEEVYDDGPVLAAQERLNDR